MPSDENYKRILKQILDEQEAQRRKHEAYMKQLGELKQARDDGTLTPEQEQQIRVIAEQLIRIGVISPNSENARRYGSAGHA